MAIREGAIPVVLGTVVTGIGATVVSSPVIAAGVIGVGAAHIVLGAIDLVEHKGE
ncbi:MAG TPA: asparagine synthase [Desulfosporosinus sp.]|nr:asparagine synthase [Desulfosporosinus sp.]